MNKRMQAGLMALTVTFLLSGCCMSHDWTEATCTEPKSCSKCGATEGEALGHTWVEATCSSPKTCSVCGETEGGTLEHTLTEASYEQPATCSVCGAQVGEPLQADFEKYGLSCVELNKIYDYTTSCYDDPSKETTAKAVFTNYQIFTSDEEHAAKEGYEWRTVDFVRAYWDDNANEYGWSEGNAWESYYDIVYNDEHGDWDEEDNYCFWVVYNGETFEECMEYATSIDKLCTDTSDVRIRATRYHYLVPVGYEGCVFGKRNSAVEWGENDHIFDLDNSDTLFFRFADQENVVKASKEGAAADNLTNECAAKIVTNLYMNMENYFGEEASAFFDSDDSGYIDQAESIDFLKWALSEYVDDVAEIPAEDAVEIAYDYMTEQFKVPQTFPVDSRAAETGVN